MSAPVSRMDRAHPQISRPIRLHGSSPSRRHASGNAAGQTDGTVNPCSVRAEHRSDVLEFVPLPPKEPGSFSFALTQLARSNDADLVQKHPGFGVSESGHRFTSFMVTVVPPLGRVWRLHAGGRSVARFVPHTTRYSALICVESRLFCSTPICLTQDVDGQP